eukprot:Em0001g2898a
MPRLLNMECSEEDIYTIAGYDFDWVRVGRRLLSDQKVRDIETEGSSEGDKRDTMLLEWKKAKSRDATYQALVKVLRAIQNNATADRVEALEKNKSQDIASTSNQSVVRYAYTSNQSTTDVPLGVVKYAEYLKGVYKVKPCGEQWPRVVSKHYINLSTVESIEDFPKEKEVTCTLAMIHAKIEEVKEVKRPITIDQTTCEAVVQWITSCEGDGVMMVLDGYDELSPDLQKSSIFANIIKGEWLPKMTVLVSSRPSANENLHQLCQDQKCQYIEVIGFGKEEIQEYVDAALGHNKELRDQLMSYLEHHPHIHGLMYCPLNCAIIVQIFREQMKIRSQPPQTLTEVYQVLIKTVLKRHEHKSVEPPAAKKHKRTSVIPSKIEGTVYSFLSGVESYPPPDNPSRFPWLGDVSDQTIPQLLVLAKLAYDGTNEDQLIFHGPSGTMETLGLLQEVPELYLDSSGSSSYHFLHKTVQEFMAALHVSSLPPAEKAEFIRTSFGKRNMTMFVRFLAGLTKYQSQDDIEVVLAFQKKEVYESQRGDVGIGKKTLDPFDCYVLGYIIASNRQPMNLILKECSLNGMCVKMLMMVEKGRAFDYIKTIYFDGNDNIGAIVLEHEARIPFHISQNHCYMGTSALGVNTTLTELALPDNRFDNQSVASLVQLLTNNQTLKVLRLQNCFLDDDAIRSLAKGLEHSKLKELYLGGNEFSTIGAAELSRVLTTHPTVKEVTVCPHLQRLLPRRFQLSSRSSQQQRRYW